MHTTQVQDTPISLSRLRLLITLPPYVASVFCFGTLPHSRSFCCQHSEPAAVAVDLSLQQASPLSTGDSYLAQYIQNELPTTLIYVPEMRLMGKDDIRKKATAKIVALATASGEWPVEDVASVSPHWGKIVQKYTKDALEYAIMSHRWGEDEPDYQEMKMSMKLDDPAPRAGLRKLHSFCEMAKRHHCDWAWSDTCCIDKTSSVELDEAIRSMYRWYRDATVCIVHLADTVTLADVARDDWFTRGWTLQELLAPRRIKFFNRDWQPLTAFSNDKDEDSPLLPILSNTTTISMDHLTSFAPGTNLLHEKMRWAAGRQTTRIEDVAYSLIGIFAVSLTIAYGEGAEAFYRLQSAIFQTADAPSLMFWCGEPSRANSMLARSPRAFVAIRGMQICDNSDPLPGFFHDKVITREMRYAMAQPCQLMNRGVQLEASLYDVRVSSTASDSAFVDIHALRPRQFFPTPVIAGTHPTSSPAHLDNIHPGEKGASYVFVPLINVPRTHPLVRALVVTTYLLMFVLLPPLLLAAAFQSLLSTPSMGPMPEESFDEFVKHTWDAISQPWEQATCFGVVVARLDGEMRYRRVFQDRLFCTKLSWMALMLMPTQRKTIFVT